MDVGGWLQIVLVCFLGAISPGPSLVLVVGNSISLGRFYGVATGLGHGVGIGFWALLTAVGMTNLILGTSGLLVMQFLGAVLIAYVGFRTLADANTLSNKQINLKPHSSVKIFRGAAEGFLVSLFNPKIALFFLAIFSHFVKPNVGWSQIGFMGLTAGVIDATWYVFVACLLTGIGMDRFPKGAENFIRKISGSLLIIVALYLLTVTVISLF